MSTDPCLLVEDVVPDADALYRHADAVIGWSFRLRARQTASFGVPYDYSGQRHAPTPLPAWLTALVALVAARTGWRANNCLCNRYPDGMHTMGLHRDDVTRLAPRTGVAVLSLGAPRVMRFVADHVGRVVERRLPPGSLLVLSAESQRAWRHAIPAMPGAGARISLTFRAIAQFSS